MTSINPQKKFEYDPSLMDDFEDLLEAGIEQEEARLNSEQNNDESLKSESQNEHEEMDLQELMAKDPSMLTPDEMKFIEDAFAEIKRKNAQSHSVASDWFQGRVDVAGATTHKSSRKEKPAQEAPKEQPSFNEAVANDERVAAMAGAAGSSQGSAQQNRTASARPSSAGGGRKAAGHGHGQSYGTGSGAEAVGSAVAGIIAGATGGLLGSLAGSTHAAYKHYSRRRNLSKDTMMVERIGDYHVERVENYAREYQEAAEHFWRYNNNTARKAIDEYAEKHGISFSDAMVKVKPGGELEEVFTDLVEHSQNSKATQDTLERMDRSLEGWRNSYERAQRAIHNGENASNDRTKSYAERLDVTKNDMLEASAKTAHLDLDKPSHKEKIMETLESIRNALKELMQSIRQTITRTQEATSDQPSPSP